VKRSVVNGVPATNISFFSAEKRTPSLSSFCHNRVERKKEKRKRCALSLLIVVHVIRGACSLIQIRLIIVVRAAAICSIVLYRIMQTVMSGMNTCFL